MKKNVKILKGKSKYPEDVFTSNHSAVWGSWWNEELGWGFKCCHSNERNSVCVGEYGKVLAHKKELAIKRYKEEQVKKLKELELQQAETGEKQVEEVEAV